MTEQPLLTTAFTAKHRQLGAKMAAFAGYDMPIHYKAGIMAEHAHTRKFASLFDVSHMGQAWLAGQHAIDLLERLTPGDFRDLGLGRMRYTTLLNAQGGIVDDLMVLRESEDHFFVVLNAGRKDVDLAYIKEHLPTAVSLTYEPARALLALQGPLAAAALERLLLPVGDLPFMSGRNALWEGHELLITRSGYTGEDGFEISVPAAGAEAFAEALTEDETVAWAGLGARDSLRLEAGLCLYGHELSEEITPPEADLNWIIGKRRRTEGGFMGAEKILAEVANGPARKRVGIQPEGRAPAREGTEIRNAEGQPIGVVTSGGFGPTVQAPIAMGYVELAYAKPDTPLQLVVRGQPLPARTAALPFVPHKYKK